MLDSQALPDFMPLDKADNRHDHLLNAGIMNV
jgi:hypothetical protein